MSPQLRPAPTACPDENVLAGFALGALPPSDVLALEPHLDGCEDCRALVAAVAAESSAPSASISDAPTRLDTGAPTVPVVESAPVLTEGTKLGPYVLREVLGAGGMGVVYAAEDPRLGRTVALKLLRPLPGDAEAEARARLLREAQAMARLSHPNVLPVFDVGTAEGRDFLAMEWVEGTTLAGWLRERERPWREVLDLFLAVGAGLAAAHRAGLVHRDFKPANVLVGRDGRPRVTDFGLARHGPGTPEGMVHECPGAREPALTRAGAVPGTPAYMAPEQRAGQPVDARCDQYSFCVALHEALHGERPNSQTPRPRRDAKPVRLPRYVRDALARGLASAPEGRFPSMDALLAALSCPERPGTWTLAVVTAGALVLVGAGLGALRLWEAREAPSHPDPAEEAAKSKETNELLALRVGEVRELPIPQLQRIAVGDPGILYIRAQKDGARVTGLSPGATHLLVWTVSGERRMYTVSVTER